ILLRADAVGSTSKAMADRVNLLVGSRLRNGVTVIPFGVDTEVFTPANPDQEGEREQLVVGTVKSLLPAYGIDILLGAFRLLREDLSRASPRVWERLCLRIAGDGPLRADLEAMARRFDIAERVAFLGRVEHNIVPDELRRLDVFVAPSRHESFGVAVAEASSC